MSNLTELKLRKLAIAVSVVLGLQLLWSAVSLAVLSEPDPIVPAKSALLVSSLEYGSTGDGEDEEPAFLARPLFFQGRNAYVPPEPSQGPVVKEEAPKKKDIKGLKLLGIYGSGSDTGAIFMYKGERRRLQLNEEIDGWTFTMYSADGVILESGGESRTLQLEHALPGGQASVGIDARSVSTGNGAANEANTPGDDARKIPVQPDMLESDNNQDN